MTARRWPKRTRTTPGGGPGGPAGAAGPGGGSRGVPVELERLWESYCVLWARMRDGQITVNEAVRHRDSLWVTDPSGAQWRVAPTSIPGRPPVFERVDPAGGDPHPADPSSWPAPDPGAGGGNPRGARRRRGSTVPGPGAGGAGGAGGVGLRRRVPRALVGLVVAVGVLVVLAVTVGDRGGGPGGGGGEPDLYGVVPVPGGDVGCPAPQVVDPGDIPHRWVLGCVIRDIGAAELVRVGVLWRAGDGSLRFDPRATVTREAFGVLVGEPGPFPDGLATRGDLYRWLTARAGVDDPDGGVPEGFWESLVADGWLAGVPDPDGWGAPLTAGEAVAVAWLARTLPGG